MIIACILSFVCGLFTVIGYDEWRHWQRAKRAAQAKLEQRISEAVTYTQGAAYDACLDEPTTDYDTEAVRRLLNSW